jgi:hypothetical protein
MRKLGESFCRGEAKPSFSGLEASGKEGRNRSGRRMRSAAARSRTRGESSAQQKLRTLFFEHKLGFFGRLLLFTISPGHISQRHRLRDRAKLPERPLAMRRHSVRGPAHQGLGRGHRTKGRVLGMTGDLKRCCVPRYATASLPQGRRGSASDHRQQDKFHSGFLNHPGWIKQPQCQPKIFSFLIL